MPAPTNEQQKPELPDPQEVARTYAEVAQRASKLIAEHMQRQVQKGLKPPTDELGVAQAFMDMMSKLLTNPYRLAQAQMNLVWDYFSLWQNSMQRFMGLTPTPIATPAKDDKRFKDEGWQDHFLFDFIKQSYLITARHIHDVVGGVDGLDPATKTKVSFFTRQYVDALSPSNFALTNPEVFRETVKSHGQNLVKGFNNLLRDIEEGDGQLKIRMTDTTAFELGKNVATTPGKVVFQNDLIQLLQYTPSTAKVAKRPLLIVPPWINKYYVLDLREKNSLIKWAVDQGHTVFVISWVNPDAKLAKKGFDDYVTEGILGAVDAITEQTGVKEINAAGYCLGGTLLATTLGYMTAKKDKRIASATFFTTLIDFSQPGELGVFIDEAQVTNLEKKMAERGYLEGSEMANTFNMLRSNDLIWSFVVNNYLLGKDPFPFDLLYWNSDSTRMPAKMHSFYLRNMYMANALREPGGVEIAGVPIDLSKVKVPAYFISTVEDHIAPWKTTYLGAQVVGGPVRFVLGGSGHIAGIVNPPAANKYGFWTRTDDALPDSSEDWLAGAEQHTGSWWTDWQAWLTSQDDAQVAARKPEDGKLPVLEDAPGSFVKFRLGAK
ncbi:PHA/PHB synthase family protein [Uliginosibacterium sp. H1]|uniref:PHA/PHB synthase family protein n=1 Tax=Uliginosibacterium sp. H1 TaxID=3114757 RepID=UPI002E18E060|nr:class I poly(R)-hydroxyalkanoic acid synthase [Uliginosibacterium sp. H1]